MSSWVFRESLLAVLGSGLAVLVYWFWPSAGEREVRAVTERVAGAMARGDRAALANEPCFRENPGTTGSLLRYGPALARGYRITVGRNGMDGHSLMSDDLVTHLGEIKTASGTLTLGFRHDRDSGQLKFVTASFSGFVPANANPK
jgi:hypothetical protein